MKIQRGSCAVGMLGRKGINKGILHIAYKVTISDLLTIINP